ncbi:sulfurtransferase complex subunit TusB [Tatumella ptyseos]|uniref:sulfurtransferase complex subunit TusB n=1 Tax=Tatumella ptyseos TaxID=82987 RepID=UPI0026F0C3C5|nr:sulfurtransferase complex subunit TusB [Tatumella ptyseos]WKX26668.1 sulfurtransferase complex subunit TusB [Tatumella ptyseos]
MLHLIMSSPAKLDMDYLEIFIGQTDDILLLQDAVYGGVANNQYFSKLVAKKQSGLYVLQEDAQARGITALLESKFRIISYPQFVELTVKHSKQITW